MLSTPRFLIVGFTLLVAELAFCGNLSEAQACVANLSRAGVPSCRAAVRTIAAEPVEDLPYSLSRNDDHESPEAVVSSNRDCCADLDAASLVFVVIEIEVQDSLPTTQIITLGRTTLLAAHVLLRI